jgi:hypothetical protein
LEDSLNFQEQNPSQPPLIKGGVENELYPPDKGELRGFCSGSLQNKIQEIIKLSKCEFINDFPK